MTNEYESLLRYYNSELTYLREMGRLFSKSHPKIAGRLELSPDQSIDPNVERTIESFAFLTARLQLQIDSQFPEISTSLLGLLYPNLVDPIPPMAIACFELDPDKKKITSAHTIMAETPVFAQSSSELTCRFRTCYPVTLWPLTVVEAGFESSAQFDFLDNTKHIASILRLRLETTGEPLSKLSLQSLRFYLSGDSTLVSALYELLFLHVSQVVILPENGKAPVYLLADAIQPVGFGEGEGVIPFPPHAHPGYRLLQEYFLFPEKFRFFDLRHLNLHRSERSLDILLLLDQNPRERLAVNRNTFTLGCTPVVNLFKRTSDPIRLDQRQHEYRLSPDTRRERTTEIHSILSVSSVVNPGDDSARLEPFYAFRHREDELQQRAFWHARRVATNRDDFPGTDVMLSFVDLDFEPGIPPAQTIYAHLLCTNRQLATQLPAGALLQLEDAAPLARIYLVSTPSLPAYPPLGGATLWKLISNLSLNYLSLSGNAESLDALKEMLRLYSISDRPSDFRQVSGIRNMECRRVMRRIGTDAWRGFCQGTEVTLTFDEAYYAGSSPFLLGAVLNRFFPLYASLNSFTELVVKRHQREGEWKRWPPMLGSEPLI